MSLRLEYDLKYPDIVLFNAVHQLFSPLIQALYLGFALFIFWAECLSHPASSAAATATVAYASLWLAQWAFNAALLYSRHDKSVVTRHVLEVRDDGLLEETAFNRSLFYWPGLFKVVSRVG